MVGAEFALPRLDGLFQFGALGAEVGKIGHDGIPGWALFSRWGGIRPEERGTGATATVHVIRWPRYQVAVLSCGNGRHRIVRMMDQTIDLDRVTAWRRWVSDVRATHLELEPGPVDSGTRRFFAMAYAAHQPAQVNMPRWRANAWTIEGLRVRVGDDPEVTVQAGRSGDPHYELNKEARRTRMTFGAFLDRLAAHPDNDVYMTANNGSENLAALAPLGADMTPLPGFLRDDPAQRFLWIGGRSETPLHHDLTNNFLVQMVGRKLVRMLSPVDVARLDYSHAVFSRIGMPSDAICAERGLTPVDVVIEPGRALFIPVGWWHAVTSLSDLSVTATYVSFIWRNFGWEQGFPG
jgi:hypothetical protein